MTMKPGCEIGDDGNSVGRDPREMTHAELAALGHERLSPMDAIRARCLDCCAGSANEVRKCTAVRCVSWPYRMGKNPWRAEPTEAQQEARRKAGIRLRNSIRVMDENNNSGVSARVVPEA